MKRLLVLLSLVALSGCSTIQGWIPSFWDDNQSAKITDVRQKIDSVNCSQDQLGQAQSIQRDLRWFELYSESKGSRQQDVLRLIKPMQETTGDWVKRAQDNQASQGYCEIKKKIMQTQSKTAAAAILGRF
jgi:hypothetical protein